MITEWDKRFLGLAAYIAKWSKDPSTQVGAVIVQPEFRTILSTGYNGFPRGIADLPNRLEDRSERIRLTVHAEVNAIVDASRHGRSLDGATLYVSGLPPCTGCSLVIIQAGIKRVVASIDIDAVPERWRVDCQNALDNLGEAGIVSDYAKI